MIHYMGFANQCGSALCVPFGSLALRVEGRLSRESMASCMGLQCGLGLSSRRPWMLFTSERRITFKDLVSPKKKVLKKRTKVNVV
jgi:hypothetical protein